MRVIPIAFNQRGLKQRCNANAPPGTKTYNPDYIPNRRDRKRKSLNKGGRNLGLKLLKQDCA